MTRLKKDAVKTLCVVLVSAFAVGAWYALTHNLIQSLCWLGLLVFLSIVEMFPSSEPGPVMKNEDFLLDSERKKGRRKLNILLIIFTLAVFIGVFFVAYRKNIFWPLMVPISVISALMLFIAWRNQGKILRPKYDERELLIQKNADRVSLVIFWVVFIFWSVTAGFLSGSGFWHLPGYTYTIQVIIAAWIVKTVYAIAVIWQERGMNNER